MSRKSAWETQPRRRTNSSSIIAIWAAGPPKAVMPKRRKESAICLSALPEGPRATAPAGVSRGGMASSFIFEQFGEQLTHLALRLLQRPAALDSGLVETACVLAVALLE